MTRQLISSGSTFEAAIGYSRAVVVGDDVFVSGTTGFDYEAMTISPEVEAQCEQALRNVHAALARAGASLGDVVRVHYLLPDAADFPACWPVLRRWLGEVRPAATMFSAGLADPRMRIEVEVTARRGSAKGLILRPATPPEAPLLRRWDEAPHVLESDPNDDWNWELELARSPPWREQLFAELDGRPVGFVQLIDPALEDSHYWGEVGPHLRALDIWLGEAKDLGHGLGTAVMELALARCFAPVEVEAVLIDPLAANTRAHRFYERLGFHFLEERDFGADHCRVYRLTRGDWGARRARTASPAP